MSSDGFWAFLGGASNYALDRRQDAAQEEREMRKMRALETLRRETSDYEYNRNRADAKRQVDARQSYLDSANKQYVMVNSEGQEVGRRQATDSELRANQMEALQLEGQQLENKYKRKSIDLLGRERVGGGRGGGLDAAPTRTAKLHSLANSIADSMKDYGVPDDQRVAAYVKMKERIDTGQADEAWLRRFEASFLNTELVRKGISTRSDKQAAGVVWGKPKKPE